MTARKPAPRRALAPKTRNGQSAQSIVDRFARYRVADVVEAVAAHTSVSPLELASGSATRRVARARGYLCAALRARGWSWTDIAALLDRDHSGCMHAVQRIEGAEDLPRLLASLPAMT